MRLKEKVKEDFRRKFTLHVHVDSTRGNYAWNVRDSTLNPSLGLFRTHSLLVLICYRKTKARFSRKERVKRKRVNVGRITSRSVPRVHDPAWRDTYSIFRCTSQRYEKFVSHDSDSKDLRANANTRTRVFNSATTDKRAHYRDVLHQIGVKLRGALRSAGDWLSLGVATPTPPLRAGFPPTGELDPLDRPAAGGFPSPC